MLFIEGHTHQPEFTFDEKRFVEIFTGIAADFFSEAPDLSLSFVEPDEIQDLNKRFRQYDEITDVLSFPADGEIDPDTAAEYLGDILICTQKASDQAAASGHSLENELLLLFIHGYLHLLGYDHQTADEKAEMWQLQDNYLKQFNILLGRKPGEDFESEA